MRQNACDWISSHKKSSCCFHISFVGFCVMINIFFFTFKLVHHRVNNSFLLFILFFAAIFVVVILDNIDRVYMDYGMSRFNPNMKAPLNTIHKFIQLLSIFISILKNNSTCNFFIFHSHAREVAIKFFFCMELFCY